MRIIEMNEWVKLAYNQKERYNLRIIKELVGVNSAYNRGTEYDFKEENI